MYEQLRGLVRARLTGAVNCPAKDDIVEEITADLTAKYNDLLEQGMEPETAFSKVQEGIGDLSEIVAFINEANRRSEEAGKTSDNPFAGLDELMRQMGKNLKNLEPNLREVASDLKSAAGHIGAAAKGLAQDSKEPLKEMAHSVKSGLKATWKNFSDSFEDSRHRYDYTVPAAELIGVEVITSGGNVTFGVSQDDNIYIVELSKTELPEDKLARIQTAGGIVTVAQGQKYSAGSVLFNYGMLQSDFELYLPQRAWNSLSVTTSGGDVALEKDLEVANLTLHTVSGDVTCPRLTAGVADISTVSGNLDVSGSIYDLKLESVNGYLRVKFDTMPKELHTETVNGDVDLSLPDNDGFTLRYQRLSGDVRSDFDLKTSLNAKNGIAIYGTGGDRHYSMQTVSGDLHIRRK